MKLIDCNFSPPKKILTERANVLRQVLGHARQRVCLHSLPEHWYVCHFGLLFFVSEILFLNKSTFSHIFTQKCNNGRWTRSRVWKTRFATASCAAVARESFFHNKLFLHYYFFQKRLTYTRTHARTHTHTHTHTHTRIIHRHAQSVLQVNFGLHGALPIVLEDKTKCCCDKTDGYGRMVGDELWKFICYS